MSVFKANKAMKLQRDGKTDEARGLYEAAFAEGVSDARYILPYALLIIRAGEFQKAKEFLVAHQKAPGMTPSQRTELLVYYAVCCLRLGNVDKGISTLEQQFRKAQTGLIYQTLGYLYIEKYDQANRPDFAALASAAEPVAADNPETDEEAPDQTEPQADPAEPQPEPANPEDAWNAGIEKAEQFIRESIEYDDEDSICLDNMGQFLWRVRGDQAAARKWFDKAIALKEGQIDTLYFLSRYDLDAGDRKAAVEKLEKAAQGRFSPLNYVNKDMIGREIARLKGDA